MRFRILLAMLYRRLKTSDPNTQTYLAGLVMLFVGLWIGVSLAVALIVTGIILAAVGVTSSFYLAALLTRPAPQGKK